MHAYGTSWNGRFTTISQLTAAYKAYQRASVLAESFIISQSPSLKILEMAINGSENPFET